MVSREALRNALRSQGYSVKKPTERSEIWKKKGRTDRVIISNRKQHDPVYAKKVLRMAGAYGWHVGCRHLQVHFESNNITKAAAPEVRAPGAFALIGTAPGRV